MKKILYLFTFWLSIPIFVYSQLEYRILPAILDAEKSIILNYFDVFRPREIPWDKLESGPERILTSSGIQIINIVNSGGGQSETFISRHPLNPNILVASANDMRYNSPSSGYRMAAFYSTDGGQTWKISLTPPNADVFVPSPSNGGMTNVDPGLAFDSKGNLYYSYIFTQVSNEGNIEDGGVFVNKSTDGGATWSEPIPVALSVGGGSSQDSHDKPFIACDANPNSPFKDRVYVTWYLISPSQGQTIGFSYSSNGEEFSPVTKIPGSVGNGSVQSPMPVVASDGTLYVVWESKNNNYTSIMVQKSTNGGVSWAWTSPKVAQTVVTIGEKVNLRMALPNKGNMRVSSYPFICLGDNPNNLFLVQAGKDDKGKYGIYLAKSTDGGETWTNRIKVDDNPYGNDMFFPAVAFDPKTKILAVAYYSSQMDPNNKAVDLFVAVSFDEGKSWNNIRVTPQSWYLDHSNAVIDAGGAALGRYWGDYLSMIAYDGKIIPCFWMPNQPRGTFFSNNAYVAILTTAPKPPDSLRYVNTYLEPNKIILKWKDPTENQLGGVLGNFKIHIFKEGNKIAEVEKGIETYTYENLVDGEYFSFSLKTVDETGLESPLVTISGVAGGALQPLPPEIVSAKPNEGGVLLTWQNPSIHTDSSYFHDYELLEIFSDTSKLYTIEKSNLLVGEIQTSIIPIPTNKFYKIKIRAVGKRGEKLTPSEFSNEVLAYSGAPLTSLSENFDNPNSIVPFYTEGTTGVWGLTSKAAYSLPNSLTDSPDGDYKPKSENYIIFAPVILKAPNLTLSFEEIAIIDSSGDAGIISVSHDFGKTWQDIAFIDMRRSSGFKDKVTESQWFTEHRSLASFENDTVLIKFTLSTTPLKNKDGWYIDDLRIDANVDWVNDLLNSSEVIDASIIPNPSTGYSQFRLTLSVPVKLEIEVADYLGRTVSTIFQGQNISAGEFHFDINLENLNQGIYFVRYKLNNIPRSIPIVLVK